MNEEQTIVELYQKYYRQISLNGNYIFRPLSSDHKLIDNFVAEFRKKYKVIGEQLLLDYFSFQFSYWKDKNTRFGKGRVMISWVVGDLARQRWYEASKGSRFMAKKSLRQETGLKIAKSGLTTLRKIEQVKKRAFIVKLNPTEEKEKERFYNKKEGLLWCMNMTTLINPRSPLCLECNNKEDCKLILEKQFKKIYEVRYGG